MRVWLGHLPHLIELKHSFQEKVWNPQHEIQGLSQSVVYLFSFTPRSSPLTTPPACLVELPSTFWTFHTLFKPLWVLHICPFPEMPSSSPLPSHWAINPLRLLNKDVPDSPPNTVIHSFPLSQLFTCLLVPTSWYYSLTGLSPPIVSQLFKGTALSF